jgi:hypothetical protein
MLMSCKRRALTERFLEICFLVTVRRKSKIMKSRWFFLLCASLIATISSACLAEEAFSEAFVQKPLSRFVPSSSEYFGPLAPAAKRLVRAEKKNLWRQHFCAIGYKYAEDEINVWVHWREGKRLVLWQAYSDPEMQEKGLILSNRDLMLGKDTVERKEDLQGSTYMETRAWWEAVAKDCAAHGEKATLAPFSARRR